MMGWMLKNHDYYHCVNLTYNLIVHSNDYQSMSKMFKLKYSINQYALSISSVIDPYEQISLYTKSFCTERSDCTYIIFMVPSQEFQRMKCGI